MAQKPQRSMLSSQRTLLELAEGKESPTTGNREGRPTSLPSPLAGSLSSGGKADESPTTGTAAEREPGLTTSSPPGSLNMDNLGKTSKENDHPSMRRNASAPITLSGVGLGGTNGDSHSLTSKNSESSDVNADECSQSGDESIKSEDRNASNIKDLDPCSSESLSVSKGAPTTNTKVTHVVKSRTPLDVFLSHSHKMKVRRARGIRNKRSSQGDRLRRFELREISNQNGMTTSQSVPEYLAADNSTVRKRSPKLGKKKNVRKSTPWYSVLQSNYKSRCEEFQKLFKGIPDTERLTVDYSCALQKEILVHGRMYVTQNYLCFYANIFKWETTLTIQLKDITAVTKERTVRFIPNALQVTTATEKYFFTSFGSRDKSFMTIFKLWQNSLMQLEMPPVEFWKWIHCNYGYDLGIPEDELPEDYVFPSKEAEDSGDDKSRGQASEGRGSDGDDLSLSESREEPAVKDVEYIIEEDENGTTAPPLLTGLDPPRIDVSDYSEAEEEVLCGCNDMHQGKQYLNEVFGVSCETLFKLLFAEDSVFYLDYVKARKSTDIEIGKWRTEEDSSKDSRVVTYIFPINSNIGPKSSQVTETQTFHRDLSKEGSCYITTNKVENKGIPYSDNFHVLGRWCITRVSENKCRLCVHAEINFTKASWFIRNIIEKQVHVGLKNGYIFLGKYLRENLEVVSGKKRKVKRRRIPSHKEEGDESTSSQRPLKKSISVHDQNTAGVLSYLLPPWLRGTQSTSRGVMFAICLVLFLLVVVNVFLYSQLQHLERKSLDRNLWTRSEVFDKIDKVPASAEDWKRLIKQQQIFHEEELAKWRDIISLCVQLMRQMETALEDLKSDIDPISSLSNLDKFASEALQHLPISSRDKENDHGPT
ncbi:protein Aster-B-like isoform X3 [Antedon mediterranea]|uniref:protein Aster-B-like isoform X3 n=1 Tax=Antedon mediterranea TaxID=105859 RepID=UPI003AF6A81D